MTNNHYSDANFRELIERCTDAFLVIDNAGIVRYANTAALKFLDLNADELITKPVPIMLPRGSESELMISSKTGAHLVLDVREKPCIWAGEPVSIWTMRDVTDQKYRQAAQLVEGFSQQQIEKWRSLESLAGGVAHQFNNLLMIILGNCSAIKRGHAQEISKVDRIEQIEKSSIRAIEITNHLLAFAGLGKYEFRELNVSETITGIKYIFETLIAKKANIEYNLEHDLPMIYADEAQLQRMLYEIITNATDAVAGQKGIISITTGVTSHQRSDDGGVMERDELSEGEYVYIQIADNGCGMDEMTQSQIFNPLFTTKSSAKGLGLSAALGIARTHRGTISVHTIPNHGTTIEIFLPVVTETVGKDEIDLIRVAETIINSASLDLESTNCTGGRILIAEDEGYMRDLLKEALEISGYEVVATVDGRDCIDKFDQLEQNFDCVILDMMMPNLDGEETLAAIRKRGSQVPVIITSGFTRQATIADLKRAGVNFLQKPYKLGDLMSLVSEILKREEERA